MNGYNFTERVRKILAMARQEAARLHHEYTGPEHMLLALIEEGGGVAATVFDRLAVDPTSVRQHLLEVVKAGSETHHTGPDLPYTSRAKKSLECAMSEARELHHSYIGTEHLLLGMLREKQNVAAHVLVDAGVTLDRARAEVLTILGSPNNPVVLRPAGVVSSGPTHGLRGAGFIPLTVDDGTSMQAYVIRPASAGPKPGLILFQEAYGVNAHIRDLAARIAAEG